MGNEEIVPPDPLGFIQRCVQKRKIFWTYHVNMRMEVRAITRNMILESVGDFEIIEAYPTDKYLPSFLVLARRGERAFHILFATDTENDHVRVVTAYSPNKEKWTPDFKRRKKP